ncbi:hypothetical protein C8F01DRAFT_1255461 [Mycena amicta]|nr:hypothetical protein C8F01DRAFT_1255461 [Mycena amicta]
MNQSQLSASDLFAGIHIGSALEGGYLYTAATPLSLFGCLGIIKASLAILFASITSPFNSARVLHDAGFELVGSAAGMIGIAADHHFEFEATSRVSVCMPERLEAGTMYYTHIVFRLSHWNKAFVAIILPLSTIAITSYLPIILSKHGTVLRITGSDPLRQFAKRLDGHGPSRRDIRKQGTTFPVPAALGAPRSSTHTTFPLTAALGTPRSSWVVLQLLLDISDVSTWFKRPPRMKHCSGWGSNTYEGLEVGSHTPAS